MLLIALQACVAASPQESKGVTLKSWVEAVLAPIKGAEVRQGCCWLWLPPARLLSSCNRALGDARKSARSGSRA